MKHIYYKNDFAVEITLLNASGEVVAPPEWQWHIEFTDGRRKYICSVDKGNAKVVGNTIMCYLDNHKFCCGEICYKFVQAIPDLNYIDGFLNLITPKSLPIELWEQESDNDVNIQSSVVPAYVVYDAYLTAKANGYTGTAEEYYDAITGVIDIAEAEAGRVSNEELREANELQRVREFDAMKAKVDNVYTKAESDARYYEKSATNTLLAEKVNKTDIVQSTGTSEVAVMSQKSVTDALSKSGFALLYELDFSDLRHFYANRVDAKTSTYYVDDGIPEWVRTCPMINNRYALNIDRFFTDNNISIESKKYTKQIKSPYVWIEIIDNNSFVAYNAYTGTQLTQIEDVSTIGEFAFCEIAKGFKLDITGFSTLVFEIDKCVKNVLSSRYGLNGSSYADLVVFRERGNKYYTAVYNVNNIRGYVLTGCVASSSYSNLIKIKRGNGNLEIWQTKINSSTLDIGTTVNAVYENSVPLINPIVSDIQDEEKLYLSPNVYNYSAPLPYIPHTTIKVYGKK